MGRYKILIGPRLRARSFAAQQTEATIGAVMLNRMLATGRPKSVRAGGSSQAAQGWGISPFIRRVHQRHLTYIENATLKAQHRHNPTIRPTCG